MNRRLLGALVMVLLLSAGAASAGQLDDGLRAIDDERFDAAARLLRPLAEDGAAAAQAGMGVLCLNGWGVPQDNAEALKWLHRAADQGEGRALFSLGLMSVNGLGVPRDEAQAFAWFDCADRHGERNGAIGRNAVAQGMSPEQLDQGRRLARQCPPVPSAPR